MAAGAVAGAEEEAEEVAATGEAVAAGGAVAAGDSKCPFSIPYHMVTLHKSLEGIRGKAKYSSTQCM